MIYLKRAITLSGVIAAGLLLTAASPAWRWPLPAGMAAPDVPTDNPVTAAKVELGRRLFYDADLSINGTMSCATCHEQRHAFADGKATHPGATGQAGRRNVPGLANVAWLSPLTFADPEAVTLERQVRTPVFGNHPVEMGMVEQEGEFERRFGKNACYRLMFGRSFPESGGRIDFHNVARALASFQRTLISFGSAYDRGTLSQQAQAGYKWFARDCAACHAGSLFTDLKAHRLEELPLTAQDQGLLEKTAMESDRARFRTPSLRNVALTGPWWHDGSARSLEEAIHRHGRDYGSAEMTELLAFLSSLSDPEFTTRKVLSRPDRACGRLL